MATNAKAVFQALRHDIADVVAFLAGPDSRWMTGQNIHAGGGLA